MNAAPAGNRHLLTELRATLAHFATSGPPTITLTDRRTVNTAMSYFWGSGGLLVLLTVLLGTTPRTFVPGVIVVGVAALCVAVVFHHFRNVLPALVLSPVVFLGSICITSLMWFDGTPNSVYKLFFVFAALYACYFFSLRGIAVQFLIIAVLSGLELTFHPRSTAAGAQWVMILGTVSVAGIWVRSLVGQVRIRASTDRLTGAANRQQLEEELPGILRRAARSRQPIAVAMIDLDLFKQFNDERGHISGDRHLSETAEAWRSLLRDGDLLVRYGGEEFLAVLPNCGARRALTVVERMRAATPNRQTCSAGIAVWDTRETATTLLTRADAALYEAKRTGRNRSVMSEAADPRIAAESVVAVPVRVVRLPQMVQPPSTTSTEPVTYEEASEAR